MSQFVVVQSFIGSKLPVYVIILDCVIQNSNFINIIRNLVLIECNKYLQLVNRSSKFRNYNVKEQNSAT